MRVFNEFNLDSDSLSYNLRGKLKPKHKSNPFFNSNDTTYFSQVTCSLDDVFTSEEEFNPEFYLKKYNISPCVVSLKRLDM